MLFTTLDVRNFRSIAASGVLSLGPVTVIIGRNNSGKSALLRAAFMLQDGSPFAREDVRLRAMEGAVRVGLAYPLSPVLLDAFGAELSAASDLELGVSFNPQGIPGASLTWNQGQARNSRPRLPGTRPHHSVVPVFARRKSGVYQFDVRASHAATVDAADGNMTSRLATLLSGEHEEGRRYRELARDVLGVVVATYVTDNGQQPGLAVSSTEGISLDRMGEGVSSALTLITELASGVPRLYLVEEPENDLHPQALRRLLQLIEDAAARGSQFLVSTHSDRVLAQLGAIQGARVYRSELATESDLPTTIYRELDDGLSRIEALAELGYEASVPLGWLVFEESSAERVVRDVLIPLFVPRLARLQTVGGRGAGSVPATVVDLHRMLVFAHLTDRNVPRAWVIVDGDGAGGEATAALNAKFPGWPADRFRSWSAANFEQFYPARFAAEVAAVHGVHDSHQRTLHKGKLAEKVVRWALSEPEEAKREMAESARDAIALLQQIEAEFAAVVAAL